MDRKKKHTHAYYDLSGMQNALPSTGQVPEPGMNDNYSRNANSNFSYNKQPGQPIDLDVSSNAADAVPSLTRDRDLAQQSLDQDPTYKSFDHTCPPPAGTQYVVVDQGISGPQYCRLSMYNAPVSESLRKQTELPLAMLVQPFVSDENVPVTRFDDPEIPRCRRCRTYVNPSVMFSDGGMKFLCNMCQFSNQVPDHYFQPIDAANRRIDWQLRPELSFGTFDIAAPPDYHGNAAPQPLNHIFLIDVTTEALKKELPHFAAMAIRSALYGPDAVKGGRIGIVTFDRTVHFYNLNPKLERAQMIVMSDLEDAFTPLEDGLFVDPIEAQPLIENLLDSFEALFKETKTVEPGLGAALSACYSALTPYGGGHITTILSGLPTWGPGHLVYQQPNEAKFPCTSPFYSNLGRHLALGGIGVDLLLAANSFVDAANCTEVARVTGGQVFSYRNFDPRRDGKRLIADLCYVTRTLVGYDIKIRARCSTGLQVAKYMGNIHIPEDDKDDPVCGSLNTGSTFAVHFEHDGKLNTKLDCHYQIAVLYTSREGERRIRVLNIVTGVSEQYKQVLNFIDIDACIGIFTRECVEQMREGKDIQAVKGAIDAKVTDVFAGYRTSASSNLPPSILLMPTSLRSLLIYCLSLKKSKLLTSVHVNMDTRVIFAQQVSGSSADALALLLYPRITALHLLGPQDCVYSETGIFMMSTSIPASASSIEAGGAYLLFNGQKLILFLQKDAVEALLTDLFGVKSRQDLDPYMNELPNLDTDISRRARQLIEYYRVLTGKTFLGIQLARQSLDGAELDFSESMIEDRGSDQPKYLDYVTAIHRKVKIQIEEKNSKKRIV